VIAAIMWTPEHAMISPSAPRPPAPYSSYFYFTDILVLFKQFNRNPSKKAAQQFNDIKYLVIFMRKILVFVLV
jgi:hypothetical protein